MSKSNPGCDSAWRASRPVIVLAVIVSAWMGVSSAHGASEFPRQWFWGDDEQRAIQDELVGKPAPNLRLSKWINQHVTPAMMKDKVLVIDFWATWCGPCIKSIPHNNEMYKKYRDHGVLLIGVCGSSSGQEKMAQVARSHKIAYPVARDHTLKAAKDWRVMWWPTYAVVDRRGVVRAVGLQPNYVDMVVQAILKEQPYEKSR